MQRHHRTGKRGTTVEIKGAIFDLDGTLVDSMFLRLSFSTRYLRSLGLDVPDGAEGEIGMSHEDVARYLERVYGIHKSASEVAEGKGAILSRFYSREVQAKPGVPEYLERLAKRGVPMCVVTHSRRVHAVCALERCGLLGYFRDVISTRDFGSDKDRPEIFEYALSLLGTEKGKTPVFEDAYYAAAAAKAAGFPVVGVYEKTCRDAGNLQKIADRYVLSMEELD